MVLKPCGKCSVKINNRDKQEKQVKCHLCADMFHQICAEVTAAICEELNKVEGLKWYCSNCRKVIDSMLLNVDAIKSLEKRMTKMEEANEKIEKLEIELKAQKDKMIQLEDGVVRTEQKTDSKNNEMKQTIAEMETTWARKAAEGNRNARVVVRDPSNSRDAATPYVERLEDREVLVVDEDEERKRSIIIHNLEESTQDNVGARIEHDTKEVVEMCKYLGNHEFNEYSMEKIFRLGRKQAGKDRPLKVCLNNNITKFKIIRNTHKLKDSDYDGISIQHDLSSEQRKELSDLVKIAKQKEEQDPTGNYVYRVRGPPGRKHLVRIRKRIEVEPEEEQTQEDSDVAGSDID